ncbi:DUF4012 domain-containing protein [Nocardioides montaniterrae]
MEDHPRRVGAAAVLTLVVLFGLWTGWRAWTVASALDKVSEQAQIMQMALGRGDVHGARVALAKYQDASHAAASRTHGPTWTVLDHLPIFGDDAHGIAEVSSVLDEIGTKALPPVVGAAGQVTGDDFRPKDHRFPLARIAAMEKPARTSEQAFADAADRLAGVDSSGFIGPVRGKFDQLRSLVGTSRHTLATVYRAARMMPGLLGADGPRNYLLVMENNAELRSMGGLAGSVSLVQARDGRVQMTQQDDMADMPRTPPGGPTKDERGLFGNLLTATGVNATMTPDAPRAAELVKDRWVLAHGGKVDGVFFVDPVAVSYLMQGLGPVPVPGFQSVAYNNVVAAVENLAYIATTDRHLQSAYQNAIARSVFNAFADGHGNPVTALRGLARGVGDGRIRMVSFVPKDQVQLSGTAIAGEMPTRPTIHPQAGIYLNDSTESKMSYYLRYSSEVATQACAAGVQTAVGTMTLTNATPPNVDQLPVTVTGWADRSRDITKGSQYVVVYLTSPIEGRVTSLSVDGKEVSPVAVVPYRGRQVASVGVLLEPRTSHTIEWGLQTGLRQTGSWDLAVTPGTQPGTQSATLPSAC